MKRLAFASLAFLFFLLACVGHATRGDIAGALECAGLAFICMWLIWE